MQALKDALGAHHLTGLAEGSAPAQGIAEGIGLAQGIAGGTAHAQGNAGAARHMKEILTEGAEIGPGHQPATGTIKRTREHLHRALPLGHL